MSLENNWNNPKKYPCQIDGCTTLSVIRSKIKTGPDKGKMACNFHAQQARKKIPKKSVSIKKITEKTLLKKKAKSEVLSVYFNHHISKIVRSEESGRIIYEPNRCNVCHLLPKRNHKSVQAHLENVVYLTLDEHTKFDSLFFTCDFEKLEQSFPNAWPIVIRRLEIVMKACTERTNIFIKLEKYLIESKEKTS